MFQSACDQHGPQVSVAVLLDNFITASAQMEQHEKEMETARILRDNQSLNPLEPLLIKVHGSRCRERLLKHKNLH